MCGRANAVINIRGSKVSPEPLEAAFREAFGVHACLLSLPNSDGTDGLHLVVESPTPLDHAAMKEVLQASLGSRGGRVSVRYVSSMPRNTMGKIVRRELTTALLTSY